MMEQKKSDTNRVTVTGQDLIRALNELDLARGQTIMVHSSLNSFGYFEGGPDAVLDTLITHLGDEGTICVPTLTGRRDDGQNGPLHFNARTTPCWTGKLCETLRQRLWVLRSVHPTHSIAAFGDQAAWLAKDHHLALTPCGEGSPWLKLANLKAFILFIGVNLNNCTLLHTAEELAGVEYHLIPQPCEAYVTDLENCEHHGWFKLHDWGTPRRFQEVVYPALIEKKLITSARVGNSILLTVRADQLLDLVVDRLKKDPQWLVKK
jgi:aminoglycoside 3-N-acetyltransferase